MARMPARHVPARQPPPLPRTALRQIPHGLVARNNVSLRHAHRLANLQVSGRNG